jgi:hypothetical protein
MKLQDLIKGLENKEIELNAISVETFISTHLKKTIADNVLSISLYLDSETDLLTYDPVLVDMWLTLLKIVDVTDIEIPELFITNEDGDIEPDFYAALIAYDLLVSNNIVGYVEGLLTNDNTKELVNIYINQKLSLNNSLSNIVNKKLNQLISLIPSESSITDILSKIPELLNGIKDSENYELIKNAFVESSKATNTAKKTRKPRKVTNVE